MVSFMSILYIWDDLRDLVPIEQFQKREKHPRSSVTFSIKLQASA